MALSDIGTLKITWNTVPAQFAGSLDELTTLVREEQTWVAIASCILFFFSTLIDLMSQPGHPRVSAKLSAALTIPNSFYNGSETITVYATKGAK